MRLLSKKHTPKKTFRKYGKAKIIIWYLIGMVIFPSVIIVKEYGYALLFFPFYVWICWVFNSAFEIYADRFAVEYSFVLLPCRLVVKEIIFDDIDWLNSRVGYRGEIYTMILHYKNGTTKELELKGSNRDFIDVVYTWKEIANYENKQ
jgi:hypothetical protein